MLVRANLAVAVGLLSACQTVPENLSIYSTINHARPVTKKNQQKRAIKQGLEAFHDSAELQIAPVGRSILQTGRTLVLNEKTVMRGSCWNYATAMFSRAGFTNTQSDRPTVFKCSS